MPQDREATRAVPTRPDSLTGRVLDGRYRIGERIARGGMAAVFDATDLRLDRRVAVKVLHENIASDRGFAARFVREARSAAKLSHPNVVAVYDQGDDDGTLFLAMELVEGHTLRDVISRETPLTPARALAYLEPVLAALAAAHRAGLIHRDVKPENVLISDQGAVKVADFGLARAVTAETQHTSTGVLIGTVSYIAPELVTEGRADARADVYSAGVMLYELLTGTKPHAGETPIQVAYKHVHEDVPAIRSVPDYVNALVARATARDPGLRPADAGVMLRQVQRVARALSEGLSSDAELTADLALPPVRHDTTQEQWSEDEIATVLEPPARRAPRETGRTVAVRRSTPPQQEEVRRPRRRGPLMVLLAVLLAAGVGGGAWWFGYARYTSAPGVLGLTQAAAAQRLHADGLHVRVGPSAYSDTMAKGLVMAEQPGGGHRVLHGGTVTLTLSKGPEEYSLPNLAGMPLDQAQDAIRTIKMTYGKATDDWSDTVPQGSVIRSDPAAGQVLRPGTVINVWVSKGQQPFQVADFTGQPLASLRAAVKGDQIKITVTRQFSDNVPQGSIISQSPPAGTFHHGDTISVIVSKGPELVAVPDGLRGMGIQNAEAALQAAGLTWVVDHASIYLGLGYVATVAPGSGTKVPKGTQIHLGVV